MKKWLLPLLYILLLVWAFLYRDAIMAALSERPSFLLLVGIAALVALFPVVPYKLVIAALGYAYGTLWAAVVAWIGTMLAATILYGLVRYLFRDRGRQYLERIKSLQTFTTFIETHPFVSIAAARVIPIVPQMAVNIFAGAAALPFWSYTAASGIGKVPGILLYAYLGGNLSAHPWISAAAAAAYVLLLGLIAVMYRRLSRMRPK
ncbi:putative membrane protein YdjX (TVP38/TMEM64 family) [Paenibacillus rhizosphaerae]|uniref:TVP38/TMEM64 family membrane protein n=1 Tax=Paenibacillus rhizosphaerae TaxID=297318 RepID=A0A839TLG1_9BACL|nr:VTT domain-containing protein [Paenibacillus rhizosphaerae]MBB3127502.1 putative membrane protein YdjX (TVP38/TMEM64 family) [Paenibacillus rhizosphaerae]